MSAAKIDFINRINTLQKQFAMPFNHLRDPHAFDDFGSDPKHIHSVNPQAFLARPTTSAATVRAR